MLPGSEISLLCVYFLDEQEFKCVVGQLGRQVEFLHLQPDVLIVGALVPANCNEFENAPAVRATSGWRSIFHMGASGRTWISCL
jgi:hypothetical protein